MIIRAAREALADLFDPALRGMFWKSLGFTLLALVLIWFGLKGLFDWLALPFLDALLPDGTAWAGWLGGAAAIAAGMVFALGLAFLVAPVTALTAGFFLDDVAEHIEREAYPGDPQGVPLSTAASLAAALRFFALALAANLVALVLLLVPGVNLVAFLLVNAYLLGREYFEFAALRFRPPAEARALRRRHRITVLAAGLLIAAFLAVPVLNLATPLFAAALMVRLHKSVAEDGGRTA